MIRNATKFGNRHDHAVTPHTTKTGAPAAPVGHPFESGSAGRPAFSGEPDVLVIGGGIIGVCTAYYLARGGVAVTLLEEHQVGGPMASSYGNIGLLVPSHATPVAEPSVINRGLRWLFDPDSPLYVKPRWNADLARWLLRFLASCTARRCAEAEPIVRRWLMASLELFAELAAALPAEVNFERKGGLFLYRHRRSWREAVATVRAEQEAGLDVAILEPDELRTLVPGLLPAVVGAVHYCSDGRIIPDRFVRALAASAAQHGAVIHQHATVFGLERHGATVHAVHTSLGSMRPRTVVLATGALSPRLGRDAGLRIPVQPAKGYSITVRRPATCPDIPLHLHDERVVITPFGQQRMRMGGTLELAGDDRNVNLRRVAAVRRAAPRYLHGMEELEVLEIWRGMRPLSADSLPILGRARGLDNLVLATGHGMIGVSLGPASGKVVAEMVLGEEPSLDPNLFRADRF